MTQRVLIVDDEPAICNFLREAAETEGWEVQCADCSDQFKQLLTKQHNVLVMDLMMPDTDGVELLRYVASIAITAKIILISGVDRRVLQSAQVLANTLGLGVLGVLSKPFRVADFIALLGSELTTAPSRPTATIQAISREEIECATRNNEWVVYYQPQIDIATQEVSAIEALVRWQHPQRGLIFPDSFIGQAEELGLIEELTRAVIAIALCDLAIWRAQGYVFNLAINISAKTLTDLSWPDRLHQQVLDAGITSDSVILEVTESGLMQDFATSLDILTRLRMKGFLLSIDDFGTGYSSMQQIMRVPANELKIDKSFVMNMHNHENAQIIVDHTIQMAHKLRLRVVAEGVETAEAWHSLAKAGCDIGQGYVISRPLPADKFTEFLRHRQWPAVLAL